MSAYAVTELRFSPLLHAYQFGITAPILTENRIANVLGKEPAVEDVETDARHCELIITLARDFAFNETMAEWTRDRLLHLVDDLLCDGLNVWREFVETLDFAWMDAPADGDRQE